MWGRFYKILNTGSFIGTPAKILHWKRNFEVYFFANFVSKVTISLKLRKFFRACGPCSAAEL